VEEEKTKFFLIILNTIEYVIFFLLLRQDSQRFALKTQSVFSKSFANLGDTK
jgi:hypothetical protein